MSHRVVFSPEASANLVDVYCHISETASPEIAARYTDAIINFCESLETFPHRGTMRDDIRPGLRITNFRKRAVIAFMVDEDAVSILGIFYGGQDYESLLEEKENGLDH